MVARWAAGAKAAGAPRRPRAETGGAAGPAVRARALAALEALGEWRAGRYDTWLAVGMALRAVDSSDGMLAEWDEWSKRCPEKYTEGACEDKWETFKQGGGFWLKHLIMWEYEDGKGIDDV
jgi:hypothetical protein